jgi:hypothetical protein
MVCVKKHIEEEEKKVPAAKRQRDRDREGDKEAERSGEHSNCACGSRDFATGLSLWRVFCPSAALSA